MTALVVIGSLGWPGTCPVHAVRIERGTIASVEQFTAASPLGARVLRADLVTPGLVDAHGHPPLLGDQLAQLDLSGARTYAESLRLVAAERSSGWLLGAGWDQHRWPDAPAGGWPLAADLDAVAGDRPAALARIDRHAVWVNTAALRQAGIGRDTADPPGGWIVRDEGGAPSGVLVDRAAELVRPEPLDDQQRRARLARALQSLAREGLVGVHDMLADDAALAAYAQLDAAGELPIRVWAWAPAGSAGAEAVLTRGPLRFRRHALVGVKAFADGALGSHGALLRQPYCDAPSHRGLSLCSVEQLAELATRCLRARASLAVHCIGDGAVHDTLEAFERAGVTRQAPMPFRIEHAQVVARSDIRRMASMGVIASMQPVHATSDMAWAETMLGDRIRNAYAWRSMLLAGVTLALGSDFPIESASPARGIWAAVTRTDPAGAPAGGWFAGECLRLTEALLGYTDGAALAAGEAPGGGICAGARADLSLWEASGTVDAPRLRPVAVVVDGEVMESGLSAQAGCSG